MGVAIQVIAVKFAYSLKTKQQFGSHAKCMVKVEFRHVPRHYCLQ